MRRLLLPATLLLVHACTPAPPAEPARPSVLLVTIDTLRADRLGCYGDAKARTPVIDALAGGAIVFESAYTPAPLTLPAHVSLMTGLAPPVHGVRNNGGFVLAPGVPTLAEALHARGLKTGAFIGGFPLARRFGLARGFDRYDDDVLKGSGIQFELAERRATEVVKNALEWLWAQTGGVFLWVHLFDPHAPYDPPAAFATGDAYRDEIAAVDAALGPLVQAFDARPGGSTVVVTSDHGEAFGEHGEWSHGVFLYDTTLRVPLIVRGAGLPAARRVRASASLVDVAATLLALSGPGPSLPGASLATLLEEPSTVPPLYAETLLPQLDFGWSDLRSWRDGSLKYVRAPRPELYDLARDPGEARDLREKQPAPARRLAAALDAFLASSGERESRKGVQPETAERLRALGYVQGPGGRGSGADPKDKRELAARIAAATGPFKDHAETARVYAELQRQDPASPVLNLRLADALLRAGRAEEALPYFQRVIDGKPRTGDPYLGLAAALGSLRRFDEAKAALEQGLAIDPEHAQIHFNLGELARVAGQRDEARKHYEAALEDPVTADRARARLKDL